MEEEVNKSGATLFSWVRSNLENKKYFCGARFTRETICGTIEVIHMLNEKIIFLFLLLILVLAGIAGAVLNGVEMRNDAIKKSIDASRKETPEAPVIDIGESQGGGCVPAGCSGQLCLEEKQAGEIMTTCEYKPEYACYRTAVCERQDSGTCGWRETEELRICIAGASGVR